MAWTEERLVGRAAELSLAEEALREADAGRPAVVELTGEPGIGKTTLLGALGLLAEEGGRLVLGGRASELERDLPYWIFVDALDEYLRTLDERRLGGLDEWARGELARVFPALAGRGAPAATVLDERYRVHRAVRELLERLAARAPLVLLLDDLHWADPASVDLVVALLRRPPQAGVLVGVALRPGQAPARLAAALEGCHRAGQLARAELGPLAEGEAEALLGGLAPSLAKALYAESGGNPFYLEQLARAARAAGPAPSLPSVAAAAGGVPPAVAAALAEELASLSTGARTLLEGGAVIGDPFEIELAAAAGGLPEAEALPALDELLGRALVRRTDAPRRFGFRHPLLRSAVYEGAGPGWRSGAHERAARALAAHGEPATARARHVEQFARRGDREAIALLREAADSSAQRAPASAAGWYRAALRLLPPGEEDVEERVALLRRLAAVLAGTGEFAESHEALTEALELVRSEEVALRVRVVADCADLEHLLGRHGSAHARLASALDELPDRTSPEAAALLLDLAGDAFYGRDYPRMGEWARRALALAEDLDDALLRAAASASLALACAFADRIEEAEALAAEAAARVDALSDAELAGRLDVAADLGNAETYLDRYEDAVRHLDRGLAAGRASGQGRLFPLLTQRKGFALTLLGRLEEAEDVLERAVEAARLSGSSQSVAWALLNRAWAALTAGDLDTALAAAEESVALGRELDDSPVRTWSACALGSALLEAGEPERCLDTLARQGGGLGLPLIPGVLRLVFLERVIQALLALGRRDEADAVAAQAEARAREVGLGLAGSMAGRARAAVALAAGDARAAADAALAAAAAADAIGARVEAARARTLAGRALAAAGEREAAAAELERAAGALHVCGAVRHRDEAERELRRLGRRHHRRAPERERAGDGIASLTARELEVAELVRERRTNREIAAALFLSEKTVETHLRHVFGKLGVTRRAAVARALEAHRRER